MIARPNAQTIVAATTDLRASVAAASDLEPAEFIGPMLINELPPLPDPIARPVPFAPFLAVVPEPTRPPGPARVAAVPIQIMTCPVVTGGVQINASAP